MKFITYFPSIFGYGISETVYFVPPGKEDSL
jgi:hypothetical protein